MHKISVNFNANHSKTFEYKNERKGDVIENSTIFSEIEVVVVVEPLHQLSGYLRDESVKLEVRHRTST